MSSTPQTGSHPCSDMHLVSSLVTSPRTRPELVTSRQCFSAVSAASSSVVSQVGALPPSRDSLAQQCTDVIDATGVACAWSPVVHPVTNETPRNSAAATLLRQGAEQIHDVPERNFKWGLTPEIRGTTSERCWFPLIE